MSTIAIVGAGPGLGLSVARTFGNQGFNIALISRNSAKLDKLVSRLAAEDIIAAAFPADVLDHEGLTQALADAATKFGRIDVLEFSPVDPLHTPLATPSETGPSTLQPQIEIQLYGAIAATQAVLPGMREAGTGTLLFTTGAGSREPVPFVANVNAAAAALRNWAINLHTELNGTGVQAAHIGIDVSIIPSDPSEQVIPTNPDFPAVSAEQISPVYWGLHATMRDVSEFFFTSENAR